jgi:hypothetical protein
VEVLDRYLEAVGSYLPHAQRADIVAELAEDLRSEMEEQRRELGRDLADDEILARLKRRGHPMSVAERYLPSRHLIGPAMLPSYLRTLRIAVGVIVALAVGGYVVFSGPARAAVPALGSPWIWGWLALACSLGYVGLFTVIFGLVDRHHRRAHATGRWDPRDPDGLTVDVDAAARRSQRVHAAADVVGDLVVLALWLAVRPVAPPELGLVVTPVWGALHWPVAVYLLASIGLGLADALRPSTDRPRLLARLTLNAVALALTFALLAGAPWVQIVGPAIPQAAAARFERWMNLSCLVTLLVIGVACLVRVVQLAGRVLGRSATGQGAAPLAAGR